MARERSVTPVMPLRLRFAEAVEAAVDAMALDVTFEDFFGADATTQTTTSMASACTKVAQGLRMEALAEALGLGDEEQKLGLALAAALGRDVDAVASAVVGARVTREEVQQHAVEIGCAKQLTAQVALDLLCLFCCVVADGVCGCIWQVKAGIMKFVVFMQALEALGVVRFEGRLEGRSLLGHAAIAVVDGARWHACLREAVGFVYFRSIGSVVDHVYMLGYGSARGTQGAGTEKVVPRARPRTLEAPLNGTQKKEQALLRARRLEFTAKRMASNLKRYTNGRMGKSGDRSGDALLALLAACERV